MMDKFIIDRKKIMDEFAGYTKDYDISDEIGRAHV